MKRVGDKEIDELTDRLGVAVYRFLKHRPAISLPQFRHVTREWLVKHGLQEQEMTAIPNYFCNLCRRQLLVDLDGRLIDGLPVVAGVRMGALGVGRIAASSNSHICDTCLRDVGAMVPQAASGATDKG